jgi:hypothetical protein
MASETLRPNAAGDLTQWFPYPTDYANWDCVNDETPDEDATYVKTGIIAAQEYREDSYNIPDSAIPAGSTINSVTVYSRARSANATFLGIIQELLRISGATYYGTTHANVPYAYTNFSSTWTTNPATGSAWTISDINALQIGVAGDSGYDPDTDKYFSLYCTQVYVVVDYTPPAVAKKPIMKIDLGPHPRSRLLFAPTLMLKGTGAGAGGGGADPWEGWFMDEL